MPDLGALNGPTQQPVDFSIWQDAAGTWHLWSCIRFTNVGGNGRLFYGWTSASPTTPFTPGGIAMTADPGVGEVQGGLQAPFVFREPDAFGNGLYYLFYGAWDSICSAGSIDGAAFTRFVDDSGKCSLFADHRNARDPMVFRVGDHWEVVYTASADDALVLARTSSDLVAWSAPEQIGIGESPFVLPIDDAYLLFTTTGYGDAARTEVYESRDPMHFDEHVATLPISSPEIVRDGDALYIASFKPNTDGMRIAPLTIR